MTNVCPVYPTLGMNFLDQAIQEYDNFQNMLLVKQGTSETILLLDTVETSGQLWALAVDVDGTVRQPSSPVSVCLEAPSRNDRPKGGKQLSLYCVFQSCSSIKSD